MLIFAIYFIEYIHIAVISRPMSVYSVKVYQQKGKNKMIFINDINALRTYRSPESTNKAIKVR